jgi:hypothetical protein
MHPKVQRTNPALRCDALKDNKNPMEWKSTLVNPETKSALHLAYRQEVVIRGASHFWSCVNQDPLPDCLYIGSPLSATHQCSLKMRLITNHKVKNNVVVGLSPQMENHIFNKIS